MSIGRPRSSTRRHETPRSGSSPAVTASDRGTDGGVGIVRLRGRGTNPAFDRQPRDGGQALRDLGPSDSFGLRRVDTYVLESSDQLGRLASIAGSEVADPLGLGWRWRFGGWLRLRVGFRSLSRSPSPSPSSTSKASPPAQRPPCRSDPPVAIRPDPAPWQSRSPPWPPSARGTARGPAAGRTRWSGSYRR